jgi:FkbM family methyltransferase
MAINGIARRYLPRSIWTWLQYSKAKFLVWRFSNRSVMHNYGGHILTVHLHDPMSEQWYDHDCERPKEIDLLSASRLQKGSTVFDIGAHQSIVAMLLAKEVGDSGRVIAVEPNPFNVGVAKLNLASNGIQNVTQLQAMISSTSGVGQVSFQLNSNPVHAELGNWGRKVPSVTLNDLSEQFGVPDVVYLDVEGYESEALKAADRVLNLPTDWCIELHGDEVLRSFGSSNSDIVKRFLTAGFDVHIMDGQKNPIEVKSERSVPMIRCHMVAIRPD